MTEVGSDEKKAGSVNYFIFRAFKLIQDYLNFQEITAILNFVAFYQHNFQFHILLHVYDLDEDGDE